MAKITNYPFAFIGFLLVVIGWFAIFSGFYGLGKGSEDMVIIFFKLESMVVSSSYVSESGFAMLMVTRIVIGFLIVIAGNSFMMRGLHHHHHEVLHPRIGDFRRVRRE